MYGVRHYLKEEFPHLEGSINELKSNNPDFAALFSLYDETDKKIYGLEIQSRPVTDVYVAELKKQRLKLKDKLYTIMNSRS